MVDRNNSICGSDPRYPVLPPINPEPAPPPAPPEPPVAPIVVLPPLPVAQDVEIGEAGVVLDGDDNDRFDEAACCCMWRSADRRKAYERGTLLSTVFAASCAAYAAVNEITYIDSVGCPEENRCPREWSICCAATSVTCCLTSIFLKRTKEQACCPKTPRQQN